MNAKAKKSQDTDRTRAKDLVRSILTDNFKQKPDDATVDAVAEKMLKAVPRNSSRSAA